MQTLHINKKIKYFILSFLCLFCISGFWVTFLFVKEAEKEEQYYIESINIEAQNTLYFFAKVSYQVSTHATVYLLPAGIHVIEI